MNMLNEKWLIKYATLREDRSGNSSVCRSNLSLMLVGAADDTFFFVVSSAEASSL